MPQDMYFLDEDDLGAVKDLVAASKDRRLLGGSRAVDRLDREEQPTEEVYVARTGGDGIPALQDEAGAGVRDRPGHASCYIYRVVPAKGDIDAPYFVPIDKLKKEVFNLTRDVIPSGAWVVVVRDKYGTWWAIRWSTKDPHEATTTTAAPCDGQCKWDFFDGHWEMVETTCLAPCKCPAPSFCPDFEDDGCATVYTDCKNSVDDDAPPDCNGLNGNTSSTTEAPAACTTTTTRAPGCTNGCGYYCHPKRKWILVTDGCGFFAGAGCRPCPAKPESVSDDCVACDLVHEECVANTTTTTTIAPGATTTTLAPIPPGPCVGSIRYVYLTGIPGVSPHWEAFDGSCVGPSNCYADAPYQGCTTPECGREVEMPCYLHGAADPDALPGQCLSPPAGTTTSAPGVCRGECLYKSDGAGGWTLKRVCEGCDCTLPCDPPRDDCEFSVQACVPTTLTPPLTTSTTAPPGSYYCWDCVTTTGIDQQACSQADPSVSSPSVYAGCAVAGGPYLTSGGCGSCGSVLTTTTTTTRRPTTTTTTVAPTTTTTTASPDPETTVYICCSQDVGTEGYCYEGQYGSGPPYTCASGYTYTDYNTTSCSECNDGDETFDPVGPDPLVYVCCCFDSGPDPETGSCGYCSGGTGTHVSDVPADCGSGYNYCGYTLASNPPGCAGCCDGGSMPTTTAAPTSTSTTTLAPVYNCYRCYNLPGETESANWCSDMDAPGTAAAVDRDECELLSGPYASSPACESFCFP